MSDMSSLRMNPQPLPDNSFRSVVSGSADPDISVDVGMVLVSDPDNSIPGGAVFFALADTLPHSQVLGLAASATEADKRVTIQYAGPMTWPTERWDRVTGGSGGLIPNQVYWVSETDPGQLVTSPDGLTVTARIGHAISPTTMMINIQAPFLTSP